MHRKQVLLLILFAGLFLAVRLLVLLSAPYAVYDDEEMYNGTAAKELLRGLKLPLNEYMYWPHEGGALLMTLLTVPFFALFGTNFVAMKLSALSVSLATFVLWYLFALRFLGKTTANCLALLYILAPPLFLKSDLMTWGHHNNVTLFISAAMYLLFAYLFSEDQPRRSLYLSGLGFSCGLGLFFAYSFFPMLLTCVLVLLLQSPASYRRRFLWFVLAAFVGFLPWIVVRLYGGFDGSLVFRTRGTGIPSFSQILEKGYSLFNHDLALSPCFREDLAPGDHLLSLVYYCLVVVCVVGTVCISLGAWSQRRTAQRNPKRRSCWKDSVAAARRVAYLYGTIFVVTYCVSPFGVSCESASLLDHFVTYRYLLPLYPILFLFVAMFLTNEERTLGKWKWITWVRVTGLGLVGALGVLSVISTVQIWDIGRSLRLRGYSYERFGWRMLHKYVNEPSKAVDLSRRIDREYIEDYYRGIGWGIAEMFRYPQHYDYAPWKVKFSEWIREMPAEFRGFGYEGLGWASIDMSEGDLVIGLDLGMMMVDEEFREPYFRGMGWAVAKRFHQELTQAIAFIDEMPQCYRSAGYYGLGRVVGETKALRRLRDDIDSLADGPFKSYIVAGASESEKRYGEGRIFDGPMNMVWGGITFREYGE